MKVASVIVAAYLLTGLHFVWRDLREPIYNRPGYVRGGMGPKLFMVLYWLPGTLFSTYLRGLRRYQVVSWAIFVALSAVGLCLQQLQ